MIHNISTLIGYLAIAAWSGVILYVIIAAIASAIGDRRNPNR